MKKSIFDSIGFKIIAFYVMLSLISLSFTISVIFENQVELISKNSMFQAEKQLASVITSLKKFTIEMREGDLFAKKSDSEMISMITETIKPHYKEFIIFSETKAVLYKSTINIELPATYKDDTSRAMTANAFSGNEYFMRIDESKQVVLFYIPLEDFQFSHLTDTLLFISISTSEINESLSALYRQAIYIIVVVFLFHILFPVVLYRTVILPIKILNSAAQRISRGELERRVSFGSRKDELGSLAESFNNMADALYQNINSLTHEVKAARTISEIAGNIGTRDVMTGLVTINYLTERIDEELIHSKVKGRGIAILIIDIDNFKDKNEVYGKQTSDILILETVRKIKENCSNTDIISRTDGDEFTVLSPAATEESIRLYAEKIRNVVESKEIVTPDGNLSITVSIGALYIQPERVNSILRYCDVIDPAKKALQKAKECGKNRIEYGSG